jgi:hypothetical protein
MRMSETYKGDDTAVQVCRLAGLRLSSKSDKVIEVNQIHPRLDVLAYPGERTNAAKEKEESFGVSIWSASQHVFAPLFDFPRAGLMPRVRFEPFEDFAVAFTCGQLLEQSGRLETEKVNNVLIERRVVVKLTVPSRDGGAAFIEHARQNHIPAKATTRAAGRTLGEIGCRKRILHELLGKVNM